MDLEEQELRKWKERDGSHRLGGAQETRHVTALQTSEVLEGLFYLGVPFFGDFVMTSRACNALCVIGNCQQRGGK